MKCIQNSDVIFIYSIASHYLHFTIIIFHFISDLVNLIKSRETIAVDNNIDTTSVIYLSKLLIFPPTIIMEYVQGAYTQNLLCAINIFVINIITPIEINGIILEKFLAIINSKINIGNVVIKICKAYDNN